MSKACRQAGMDRTSFYEWKRRFQLGGPNGLKDLPVGVMLTDNGREFCETERYPYELYLALNDIEHRKTGIRSLRTNGFIERFNGTVLEEFFRPVVHQKLFASVEALQADLDVWLAHYSYGRPQLGYRDQGRRPWETVERFVRQEG